MADMSESDAGFEAALNEAKNGASEGGVPIGACLVSKDGKILGQGHNMRLQKGSATLHVSLSLQLSILCLRKAQSQFLTGRNIGS
jgi:tRNA(Arg) A34 adenosine deaminase TadA